MKCRRHLAELDLLNERGVRGYLTARSVDVIVHAATARSNRRLPAAPDLLDRNCRMFFNLARNAGRFGKMIHFGSGAEYDRSELPPRVKEDYFDTRVPADAYGFSKYICAKYIERAERVVDLRLFGVFGPYEDYTVRFISNACCRVLKGLPIVLRQDLMFDYMSSRLARIRAGSSRTMLGTRHTMSALGGQVALTELARMVAEVSGCNPSVSVIRGGMGSDYTGDNSRLLGEMGEYQFQDVRGSVAELYAWYAADFGRVDSTELEFDSV